MMHECNSGESTHQGCIHASCRPYGVDTLPKGWHDAWMQPWRVDSPGLHSCIIMANGHNILKHCAALKGLRLKYLYYCKFENMLEQYESQYYICIYILTHVAVLAVPPGLTATTSSHMVTRHAVLTVTRVLTPGAIFTLCTLLITSIYQQVKWGYYALQYISL